MSEKREDLPEKPKSFLRQHPVFANVVVIVLVAILGIWIIYLSLQLFTKHGASKEVPAVENMSYTQAIEILHSADFRVDIRDSVFNEDVKPGYVIEQFPKAGSIVKPGRKIFLYINAVHPREVLIDPENIPKEYALKGYSYRQAMAQLEELGFKNIQTVWVNGESDRIINITANGRPVKKMEKVPINAKIVVKCYDGKLSEIADSIQYARYLEEVESEHQDSLSNTVVDWDKYSDDGDDLPESSYH